VIVTLIDRILNDEVDPLVKTFFSKS
jgi:hypothetical protein